MPAVPAVPAVPVVRPSAAPDLSPVAAMDWDSLASAVAACEACGLCRTRRQTVFGVGHRQAHCMVVGEAPGEQEDRQGEPFVGKSGQLLDNMLRAIGLTRGEAMIEFSLSAGGEVKNVRVVSATHPIFGRYAARQVESEVKCVGQGHDVPLVRIPFSFKLD